MGYLRCANIYFVPILRLRLSFAVLVQRAQQQLGLDTEDAIAVALPQSVRPLVQKAIGKLPALSLVFASLDKDSHREVFPVTPADGIVEAIRIAGERGIDLECIDRELAPGHLAGRSCEKEADWPDDELALQLGVPSYMELISYRIAQPPIRTEPVDTWRELAMAEKLRRLQPLYRRILCVCEAAHVGQITRLLGSPSQPFDVSDEASASAACSIAQPALEAQLQYLDDSPKLVQLYEEYRREGRAGLFDKRTALLDAIRAVEQQGPNLPFSVRQYESFLQYILNLLSATRRVSPRPNEIYEACCGCFDAAFAERVHHHLVEYFHEIQVERVGRWEDTGAPAYRVKLKSQGGANGFVSRSCNPTPVYYIRSKARVHRHSGQSSSILHNWPPCDGFHNRMRRKAHTLATEIHGEPATHPFWGSLESGIDPRRSLRSLWRGKGTLYVKHALRRASPSKESGLEPVVWLLDLKEGPEFSLMPWFTGTGTDLTLQYCEWLYFASGVRTLYESDDRLAAVQHRRILGYTSFSESGTSVAQYQSLYGSELPRKLPRRSDLERVEGFGDVPIALVQAAWEGAKWWEILLLAGIIYATEAVVCVLPDGFRVSDKVLAEANRQRKRLVYVSLGRFEHREREKLSMNYEMRIPEYEPAQDINDPDFVKFKLRAYAHIMKRFWVD